MVNTIKLDIFNIIEYDDYQYFIEPSEYYYQKYSDELINEICPKYSYGNQNKICFCRIYPDESGALHISHFNNYVRNYFVQNKKLIEYNRSIYKGLGIYMLKNILEKYKDKENTKIILDMVDTRNKNLVKFYENLSFVLYDEDNFYSNIKDVLVKIT